LKITEVKAKSVLRKHKKVDSWFISRYGMNLYRGCQHNCAYCDGRAEGYYVDGDLGCEVEIKTNATKILDKELNPERKRKPLKKGFIMLGGGVNDTYQPINRKYELSRKALEIVEKYNFPVHVLTKSTLVEHDLDLIKKINKKQKSIVSFSFSTVDDDIAKTFEPGVPSPSKRIELIKKIKKEGLTCGVFLMPVIPFISDSPEKIQYSVSKLKQAGVDFIIFGGMTLKPGRQMNYYYDVIETHFSEELPKYKKIYSDNKWGQANWKYYEYIGKSFNEAVKKEKVPSRIPAKFYNTIIDKTDLSTVILEQIDYLLKPKWRKNPYSYAAYSISQLNEPIENYKDDLTAIKGIGEKTAKIILEIIETGTSIYYEDLINHRI
jgi:DNA repair photolyase